MAIYVDGKLVASFGGRQGPPGPQGAPGADGQDGAPGPRGDPGDTPYIGDNGNWWVGGTDTGVSAGGSASGVTSFNGRTGDVKPQEGDYTAEMVGALSADTEIPAVPEWARQEQKPAYTAAEVGAATMEQVNAAIQAAVLDSWEGSY